MNTESSCDLTVQRSGSSQSSDLDYFFGGQFSPVAGLTLGLTVLCNFVCHIIELRAGEKMTRVPAFFVIATMQNGEPVSNWADYFGIDKTMGSDLPSTIDPNASVAIPADHRVPFETFPAASRKGLLCLSYKIRSEPVEHGSIVGPRAEESL